MGRRKRYSAELKREALRRANEPGVTDLLVAEELGINPRQLRRWRDAVKRDGEEAFPNPEVPGSNPGRGTTQRQVVDCGACPNSIGIQLRQIV